MRMRHVVVSGALSAALLACTGTGAAPTGTTPADGGAPASVTSQVTEAEARAMAENMLEAYNSGDYAAWSRDWSQVMKDAIPESAFRTFRDQQMAAIGRFLTIEDVSVRPGEQPGVIRWEFTTQFERGRQRFWFALKEGSKLVEGVRLEAIP